MTPDTGRPLDTLLSWKYDGRDPDPDRPGAVRVVVRLEVEKANGGPLITLGPRVAGMRPVPGARRVSCRSSTRRAGAAAGRRA